LALEVKEKVGKTQDAGLRTQDTGDVLVEGQGARGRQIAKIKMQKYNAKMKM